MTARGSKDEPVVPEAPAVADEEEPKEPVEDPADDPTVIDGNPADEEGNPTGRVERKDPNVYPDPENPPHTP